MFKMKDGVLIFTKAANRNWIGEVWRICLPESMVKEVWSLCHQSDLGGHRRLEGTLNKFLNGFFLFSARQKLRFLNGGCDTCLTKERSMLLRTREHVPSLTVYVGEKLYIDLVSISDNTRGNRYLLSVEDNVSTETIFHREQISVSSAVCIPSPIRNPHIGQGVDGQTVKGLWVTRPVTLL